MNWTSEAQSRTETEPQFKQMELKAAQVVAIAGRRKRGVVHAAQQPLAVLLDVDDAVARPARRRIVGVEHGCRAFFKGDIRSNETQRRDVDAQLEALVLGEAGGRLLDGVAALEQAAGLAPPRPRRRTDNGT
jgi:hypothetical protein